MNISKDFRRTIFLSIVEMDKELGLVMITEYSSESYVLLRRKMCWDTSDVLYLSINNR